jgi:hypothetical protein
MKIYLGVMGASKIFLKKIRRFTPRVETVGHAIAGICPINNQSNQQ